MPRGTNPLQDRQWHLDMIGDLDAIWSDFTGRGVRVGIYDDGVQSSHADLRSNYLNRLRLDQVGSQPNTPHDGHGTAVAGIIAAADNDTGGIGIAYESGVTGVNYLTDAFSLGLSGYLSVMEDTARFDVVNFSWGASPRFMDYSDIGDSGSQASLEHGALQTALNTGREGLGSIFVKSAGNYANDTSWQHFGIWGNANGDGLNATYGLIVTGATDRRGHVEDYSNWGHSLLVSAPSASATTDISGELGFTASDFVEDFGGTSAAAPVVSGVVALMLEANSGLHWRDVQNILSLSARQTGSAYGDEESGYEVSAWLANDATNWNGGGVTFSESYGYGQIDVFGAVRMAEVWSSLSPDTAENASVHEVSTRFSSPVRLQDNARTEIEIEVNGADIEIEHLYVTVDFNHAWISDVEMTLVSPDGMEIALMRNEGFGSYSDDWTFGVTSLRGMSAEGTWILRVADTVAADVGMIFGITLEFHGSSIDTDDIYTFTEDYLTLLAAESDRRTITEEDGGQDWINAAALQGDIKIDLRSDHSEMGVDGRDWVRIDGVVEHFAGGDGDDTVSGNFQHNRLIGARGRDLLHGGAGNDTLDGGHGDDYLQGDDGSDEMKGGYGLDTLYGASGDDVLDAGNDDDYLDGGVGKDHLDGGDGHDQLYGGADDDGLLGGYGFDTLYGDGGVDTLDGGERRDALYGGSGCDHLFGGADNDRLWGDDLMDVLRGGSGEDRLFGGTGDDLLFGDAGFDRLVGGAGSDKLYGGHQADTLLGGWGDDQAFGGMGFDRIFAGSGDDEIYGEDQQDGLFGEDGNDQIYGGAGGDNVFAGSGNDVIEGGEDDDTINAGSGFDRLDGGEGDDVLRGNFNADIFVFKADFGNDTITDFEALNPFERIDLRGVTAITGLNDLMENHLEQFGSHTTIKDGEGNSITLLNVSIEDLDSNDFIF